MECRPKMIVAEKKLCLYHVQVVDEGGDQAMLSNLLLAGPPVITSEPDYVRDPGLGTAIPVVRRSVVIDEVEVSQIKGSLKGFAY